MLHQRIGVFTQLPLRLLDQISLQSKQREIGRHAGASARGAAPN
jgi:hypothetical protein